MGAGGEQVGGRGGRATNWNADRDKRGMLGAEPVAHLHHSRLDTSQPRPLNPSSGVREGRLTGLKGHPRQVQPVISRQLVPSANGEASGAGVVALSTVGSSTGTAAARPNSAARARRGSFIAREARA